MTDDMQPVLRRFEPTDTTAVTELFLQVGRDLAPPSMQVQLARHVAEVLAGDYSDIAAHYAAGRGRGFWVVTTQDGRLLGNYGLKPVNGAEAELRRFYVSPAARGRGIARLMLEDAEMRCRAWGFDRLVLSTSELHVAALRLYRGHGFEETRSAMVEIDGIELRVFHLAKRLEPAMAG
jgi:GNAT superfamily N-acetyltransferase